MPFISLSATSAADIRLIFPAERKLSAAIPSSAATIVRHGHVDGANSLWNIQSYSTGSLQGDGILYISENASGCQLIISNGGQVKGGQVIITRYTSGTGNSALVTGGNSLWNLSSDLVVGDYGNGTVSPLPMVDR